MANKENIVKKRTLLQRIVNVFLYIGIGVIIILLAFLGFSQTSTFRNFLKDTVVEKANDTLNGKISIGKIDGTIFTSLVLRNTVVTMHKDTLLNAGIIELKTSPLQLFWKKIYLRKLELKDTRIVLIKDSTGELNITKLIPPTKSDTAHSKFPFTIIAPDIRLTNVDFSLQDYNKVNSNQFYDNFNLNDLRVKDINLSLGLEASISNKDYRLNINQFSLSPNLNYFNLRDLTGEFLVSKKGISLNDLKILTDDSNIKLDGKVSGLNLFDSTSVANIDRAKVDVSLNAEKFSFDDLSSFIKSTNILKGTVSTKLNADGTFSELNIRNLHVGFLNTELNLKGKIDEVVRPDKMFISTKFYNSKVNEPDVNKLLPRFKIPSFRNIGQINFDTLSFDGNPLNFKTEVAFNTNRGRAFLKGKINLTKPVMEYDVRFLTRNFNLLPFIGIPTSLNSKGKIKGSGTNPEKLNAALSVSAFNSSIKGNSIDSLKLKADAKNKNINYSLLLKSSIANSDIKGKFNFTDAVKPSYEIKGVVNNLNMATVSSDTSVKSNLNFNIDASVDNFNLDKMDMFLVLHLNKSQINNINIDSARTIVDIRSNDNGERIINIISDLADITFEGNFSFKNAITFASRESNIISKAFKEKISQIMHPDSVFNRQLSNGISRFVYRNKNTTPFMPSKIKYLVEFKNFDLLSLLLANSHLQLDGSINGEINNSADTAHVTMNTKFNYIKYWSKNNVFFLSNLNMKLGVENNLEDSSFANIKSKLHITTDRLFAGNDFHNLYLDFNLDNNIANIDFSARLEDYLKAALSGKVDLSTGTVKTDFNKLAITYNKFDLSNKGNVVINYSPDNIEVNQFDLIHNGGEIKINGTLERKLDQNLKIQITGIKGKDISTNLFGAAPENSLDANINIFGDIKGNFDSPLLNLNFNADSISFRKQYFGFIKSAYTYRNKNLNVDLKFYDTTLYESKTPLVVFGNIPIDLALVPVGKRFPSKKQVNMALVAKDFNLGALGNLVPMINRLKGDLNANLKVKGTLPNIDPQGNVTVTNADFIAQANNLEYTGGLKLNIKNQKITLDSLLIANAPGTKEGGTITGSGYANLNQFELSSAKASINGKLKVLSDASKAVSPLVYGTLVVQTDGDIVFTSDNYGSFVNAPIIIQDANLTFPPTQSAYQNSAENFIYRYAVDTTKRDTNEIDFEKLIKLSQSNAAKDSEDLDEKPLAFDYALNVKVQNEATLKFLLSKELNQSLTAILKGNFQYDDIGGKTNAQGELTLLDGSTLDFLKTFEASGTIRFESELSNPYLNIVATYTNYYTPPEPDSKEEQVAVKIKLNGPLKDLSKNLIQDKNNIAVYMGADNISNNKPDATKDVSDAVMFILTGKFPSDLSAQQQSQAVKASGAFTSTATSFAGSLLGGFLNHYLGDYVRGVELRSVGSTTKFNLVGKVKQFRYTIGGSTDVFQDLNQVNVKIEYPIFKNFLLRIERKDAITQTTTANQMINELGLKYRFEF